MHTGNFTYATMSRAQRKAHKCAALRRGRFTMRDGSRELIATQDTKEKNRLARQTKREQWLQRAGRAK